MTNVFDGIASEDILIEGEDTRLEKIPKPTKQLMRYQLRNRSHARVTELTLFEGGWLSLREHRHNSPGNARLIDLRFVDPAPEISRYTAERALHVVMTLLAVGLLSGTFAYLLILTDWMAGLAAISMLGAMTAAALYVYRTQERVVFRTLNGRAPVISLLATLGCFRACRAVVPEVVRAIKQVHVTRSPVNKSLLREEMREHYRLKDCGLISADVCAASTQRILSLFD